MTSRLPDALREALDADCFTEDSELGLLVATYLNADSPEEEAERWRAIEGWVQAYGRRVAAAALGWTISARTYSEGWDSTVIEVIAALEQESESGM